MLAPPGGGKGTQGVRLAAELGVDHISSGDAAAGRGGGRHAARARGRRVHGRRASWRPTRSSHGRCGPLLDAATATCSTASRARSRRPAASTFDAVVYLDVPQDAIERRLLARGRADDTPGVIDERLRQYAADTRPLIDHYRERGVLVEVDGDRPPDEITAELRVPAQSLGHDGERGPARERASGVAQRLDHVLDQQVLLAGAHRDDDPPHRRAAAQREHDDVAARARRARSSGSARRRCRPPPSPAAPGSRRTRSARSARSPRRGTRSARRWSRRTCRTPAGPGTGSSRSSASATGRAAWPADGRRRPRRTARRRRSRGSRRRRAAARARAATARSSRVDPAREQRVERRLLLEHLQHQLGVRPARAQLARRAGDQPGRGGRERAERAPARARRRPRRARPPRRGAPHRAAPRRGARAPRPRASSVTPRALRSSTRVPSACSSRLMCWETAGCVKSSATAASENEPRTATSRNVVRSLRSSITDHYGR